MFRKVTFVVCVFFISYQISTAQEALHIPDGWFYLLGQTQVQKDVGLTADQIKHLAKGQQELRERYAKINKEHTPFWVELQRRENVTNADRKRLEQLKKAAREKNYAITKEFFQKALEARQIVRIKQIALQRILNNQSPELSTTRFQGGYLAFLLWKPMKEELAIPDSQVADLVKSANQLQTEFDKELSILRNKYRKKMNGTLTKKQREKLQKLLGKEFHFDVRGSDF